MKPKNHFKYCLVVLGVLVGILSTSLSYATSRVFVQNNTSMDLVFNTTSTLGGAYWKNKARVVKAWHRGEIFETNRDEGVKDGKTYYFTSEVTVKDPTKKGQVVKQYQQNFALRLKLRGSTVNSHMWQSVRDQVDRQHTWHDDRKKWNAGMRVKKRRWNVKYWAFYAVTEDNVEYVFQEEYPLPEGNLTNMPYDWKRNHLNVLSYNIYMRPTPHGPTPLAPGGTAGIGTFFNGQSIRAGMIPGKISGYDVIVFQEAFDDDVRAKLLKPLKKEYPYHSRILGSDRGVEQDGGVIIISKWPIVNGGGTQKLFGDVCDGWDCWADKGVLYVKINKAIKKGEKNYFHIFGTHMNDGEWKDVQTKQLRMIKSFIDAQKIPSSEPVIIAGDFNVDKYGSNFPTLLKMLNAGYMLSGPNLNPYRGHRYTHDGPLNDLGSGSQSYYDYVLYSKAHSGLTPASFAEVRVLRANDEWKEFPHESAMWDLSDHFAVYANLHFHYDPLKDWDPGIETRRLTRYYNGKNRDVVAVATTNEHNTVKQQGYSRVGDHGLLFRSAEAADQWSKSAPTGSGEKRATLAATSGRKGSTSRRSLSRIRSRGIPQEGEPVEGIELEVLEDSGMAEEDSEPLELNDEDLQALEETYEEIDEGVEAELAMEPGQIVERGLRRKSLSRRLIIRPSSKSSTKPAPKRSGQRMVKGRKKGLKIVPKPVVPLNLYYSDKYKDYFSTTSVIRAKQAMQGGGKYRHVGTQGYVFSQTMFRKLPTSLRSRMIPMTSWYNGKTRDNLIATSPGDRQHAKQNGYRQVRLEGYLIIDKPMPPKGCKANSDCPSSHYCDVKQKVCRPDIR